MACKSGYRRGESGKKRPRIGLREVRDEGAFATRVVDNQNQLFNPRRIPNNLGSPDLKRYLHYYRCCHFIVVTLECIMYFNGLGSGHIVGCPPWLAQSRSRSTDHTDSTRPHVHGPTFYASMHFSLMTSSIASLNLLVCILRDTFIPRQSLSFRLAESVNNSIMKLFKDLRLLRKDRQGTGGTGSGAAPQVPPHPLPVSSDRSEFS